MNRAIPVLLALLLLTLPAFAAPLRVACVGDSITFGLTLPDRETLSYPATLQRLSGDRYLAGNFGVSGATALHVPYRSWIDTPACRDALAFAPDLVVVMLGINDIFFPELHDQFPAHLRTLLARFQTLPSSPRLFLCTLTPVAPAEQRASANQVIRDILNPAIRAVAAQTGATVIDISAAFPNRLDLLPDSLHPTPAGAELIARTVLASLDASPPPPPSIPISPAPGPVDLSIRNEALAARFRAEQWTRLHPPPDDLADPSAWPAGTPPQTPEDIADLLPLLDGAPPPAGTGDPFLAFARLARALDLVGHETVFLAPDRPVSWREALLHQLVQRQRIDASGGGYWEDPQVPDAPRSTAHALQAIATALRDPPPLAP